MSLAYNNTSSNNGIIQEIEKECGFEYGAISGNTALLQEITSQVNLALDDYLSIGLTASGTWQLDDSNHTKYPIIKTNLVSGQRDYSFTTDGDSNLILDIYQVAILPSATSSVYIPLEPFDEFENPESNAIITEATSTGTPYTYGKLANGIFLEPKPNYNATSGLKVFINREGSYFTTSDTTKKPGVPGIHHRYFVVKPAMVYARRNNLSVYGKLADEVLAYEGDKDRGIQGKITRYFAHREKDKRNIMTGKKILYK